MFQRVVLIVLDGVGVGELPDAFRYKDIGVNTLAHISAITKIRLPNLERLGLGHIIQLPSIPPSKNPIGAYGKMAEKSAGKDTTTGHWELAGLWLTKPFPTYPAGFPKEIIKEFERRTGRKTLGNKPASGTEIIEELGEFHIKTGFPIIYTSADSVFQIAAHEEVIPLEELYWLCQVAREILTGEHMVARVIARPFRGKPGSFVRTEGRRDFSLPPPRPTVLDNLKEAGLEVYGIGKIEDIFAGRGITYSLHTSGNKEGIETTLKALRMMKRGLIWTNLVDFDTLYGHRRDVYGFAQALEFFDQNLPVLMAELNYNDLMFITADHGCDPTAFGTDHTREYVPLLAYSPSWRQGIDLGARETYADVAATIAENFKVQPPPYGKSFLEALEGLL